jgi:hypothetical protein
LHINGNRIRSYPDSAEVQVGDAITLRQEALRLELEPAPEVDPACLGWNGGIIPQLTLAVRGYEALWQRRELKDHPLGEGRYQPIAQPAEANPAAIALLADALEDSRCADLCLLGHLRTQSVHWRGCWAVSLLLGQL